ncbi:hypothetical protein WCE34_02895 [Luteimonas sp. MJ204]|uniref:hypothetical protein n=1 Tax=Luteimonas sp. MJ145 TaxID=3129234 RepID=UPI0031BAA014
MIKELLEASGGRLLLPLAAVLAGVYLARGLFGLSRFRSQSRRDFLELFRDWQQRDDLWLTVAVRHLFGAYLPPALIRRLMAGPQPGRALLEVANAWDLIDLQDDTGEVYWRSRFLGSERLRRFVKGSAMASYVMLAAAAVLLGLGAYAGGWAIAAPWVLWVYAGFAAVLAFRCLDYGIEVERAHVAANRWCRTKKPPPSTPMVVPEEVRAERASS